MTVDAENLLSAAKDEKAKSSVKKLYEAARYSDPVSNTALASLEDEIDQKLSSLTETVNKNETEQTVRIANEITDLLAERNRKCKMFK